MNQLKHALKFGAIAGAVMIASWWISNLIFAPAEGEAYDFSQGEWLGYLSMLLALTAVFVGVKNHRDHFRSGIISFREAFVSGFYIVLVASVIYVIGWMIYYPNFMPDFPDQYMSYQLEQYKESGLSEAEITTKQQEMKEWMDMYKNPFVMAGMTFMEIFPVGLIVALIAAAVLKKKG